jgi:hypothetical protein
MSDRLKWLIVVAVSVVALGATAAAGVFAWQQYQARANLPSEAETTEPADWATGDRVVFRNTASGDGYGHVASVALADPSGGRAVTTAACDRVDAVDDEFMCLRIERGIVPSYTATLYSSAVEPVAEWPLTGIPSRTRISDDGELVATTAFVTGHSYATIGFSTETQIRTRDGESIGDLEGWTLTIDGEQVAPVDRNYWGVTFIDDTTFYATAGLTTEGRTYLVKGDIAARTLTSVAADVECPSLSPDGTRLAFKSVTAGTGPTVHWTPAVMDLATGEVTLLPESRSIDDQIEWLDDDTVLYGMPRDGVAGDYDVWALDVDGSGAPEVLIEHAWSPSVVRR